MAIIIFSKKTKILSMGFFIGAMINLILNYFFLARNGIIIALAANYLGYFCLLTYVYKKSLKKSDINFQTKKYLYLIIILTILSWLRLYLVNYLLYLGLFGFFIYLYTMYKFKLISFRNVKNYFT